MSADEHAGRESEWVVQAFERTRERLAGGWRDHLPWRRGLWVTARPSYRPLPLPPRFEIMEFEVPGGRRRLAFRAGRGRPLLILPGLYAALDEALFCHLAQAASRATRPIALLEDQLATPTLRISGGRWTSFAEQGQQAQIAARLFSTAPDVLALSAGGMVALCAPAGTWNRLVAWSAVVDDGPVRCVRESRILSWHFRREHARVFRAAGLHPLAIDDVLHALFRGAGASAPSCPALFVHAEDDPVAPVGSVRRRIATPLVTRWGGHLGFGMVAGVGVYLTPYEPPLGQAELPERKASDRTWGPGGVCALSGLSR